MRYVYLYCEYKLNFNEIEFKEYDTTKEVYKIAFTLLKNNDINFFTDPKYSNVFIKSDPNYLKSNITDIDAWRGETLNTPMYLFQVILEKYDYVQYIKDKFIPNQKHVSISSLEYLPNFVDDNKENEDLISDLNVMNDFLRYYFTFANTWIIPSNTKSIDGYNHSFNTLRSGYFANTDNWTSTLFVIKDYYDNPDKYGDQIENQKLEGIYRILEMASTRIWLDLFKTKSNNPFKKFIDDNLFNAFVDDNYNIIPLFENHGTLNSDKKLILSPENKNQVIELLQNMTSILEKRTKDIEDKLLIEMKKESTISNETCEDIPNINYEDKFSEELEIFALFESYEIEIDDVDDYVEDKGNESIAKYGTDLMRSRLMYDSSPKVRKAVAKYGTDEQREQLLFDESAKVRKAIVKYGNDKLRWELLDDEDSKVRKAVAKYGTDEMRWRLMDEDNVTVRKAVAKYGTYEMRWELMKTNNKDIKSICLKYGIENISDKPFEKETANIKLEIAKYGSDDQKMELICDSNKKIRRTIVKYGNDEIREELLNDPDEKVRKAIAKYGNDELRDLLINDNSKKVRKAIAKYGTDLHRARLI